MKTENLESESSAAPIGRNEPCPCGSGKKYKRCCGVNAAPILGKAKNPYGEAMAGMDPAQLNQGLNPEWAKQFAELFKRLPRGQMQKLQSLMQRAMSGVDVSQEMGEFEKTLPVDFQSLLANAENQNPDLKAKLEAAEAEGPKPEKEASKFSKFWKKLTKS